jgi:hypothetical protein
MNFKEWLLSEMEDLPKFLTAKQMFGSISLEDQDDLYGRFDFAKGDDKKLLNAKYKLAKEKGLVDDILKNGIKSPLEIHVDKDGNQTLTNGHHRLAIALKHFPNKLIPVTYWEG